MLRQLQQAFGLIPNIAAAMAAYLLMTNDAAPRFFNHFIDMDSREGPRNMLHLIFDPQGMRPFVADWDNVSRRRRYGSTPPATVRSAFKGTLSYKGIQNLFNQKLSWDPSSPYYDITQGDPCGRLERTTNSCDRPCTFASHGHDKDRHSRSLPDNQEDTASMASRAACSSSFISLI